MATDPAPRVMLLASALSYRPAAFYEAARKLGVEVVTVIDLPANLAEHWHVELGVPFSRLDESTARLGAYLDERPVGAIVPVDDGATQLAARVAARAGLAYNAPAASLAARDKLHMRTHFAAAGVPSPAFQLAPLSADPAVLAQSIQFPCVVKPRQLSGSRGVIRADDPASFVAAFNRVKRILTGDGASAETGTLLVEDFIPGFEVALEGLLTAGELRVLALFDKPDPLDGPFFEETIYVTPSRLDPDQQAALSECASFAAAAVGLREGPLHAELRVNEHGPWMVELAGRSIGGLCSSVLEFGAGMTLEELLLRHALGLDISGASRTGGAAGVMMIPIPRGGWLRGFHGVEEACLVPLVTGVTISAKLNQHIVALPEGASYLGFIFARGDTAVAVESALRVAHSKLAFQIQANIPILVN